MMKVKLKKNKLSWPKFLRNIKWGKMANDILMTFIGTTISIVLTFGTAYLRERKQQREMERTTALMVIHNIESCYYSLVSDIQTLQQNDSIIQVVMQYVPDSLDRLSDLDISGFFTNLLVRNFSINDVTVENVFSASIDTWKNVENHEFIEIAGNSFAVKHLIIQLQQEMDGDRREAYRAFYSSELVNSDEFSSEMLLRVLQIPEIRYFVQKQHDFYLPSLQAALNAIKSLNAQSKKIMHVSDEELRRFGHNHAEKY